MTKLAEISLILGLALAVLAFGGAETISFSIVEILFFGAAAWFLATSGTSTFPFSKKIVLVPAVLAGIVLLQLCPLPSPLLHRFASREIPETNIRAGYLSFEPYATRTHFLLLLTCFIAFYFAQMVSQDRRRKQFFIGALIVLGTFEAFYGLVQYLSGWQQIFAYVKKYDLEEATGTYINRNHFAGLLEMILPFSLALAFYEFEKLRRRQAQSPRRKHKLFAGSGFARAIFWVAVAVLIGVALLFSRSRMGILAGVLSSLFLFGLVALSRLGGRSGLWLAGAFLVLGLALTLWIGPGPVLPRFQV